tara:strand:+ start:697 stop:1041 length:345 start_codon:yes stop_codon:yes gene_type:complete
MKKLINFLKNLFKKDISTQTPIVTITVDTQSTPTTTPKPIIVAIPTDSISTFLLDNNFTFVSQTLLEKNLSDNSLIRYDTKTKTLVKTMVNSKISVEVRDDLLRVQKFLKNYGN